MTALSLSKPHGLKTLLDRIKEDEYAKNLILDFDSPLKAQAGKGILKKTRGSKRSVHQKCLKKVRFCPNLWKKF